MKPIFKGLVAALGLAAGMVFAGFPDKPVRLIVPYPAGGTTDAAARIVSERLTALWGQPVIVENRAGAQGAIGTEFVAKAPADGYTLLLQVPIMLQTELIRPSVGYRALRDFHAVTTIFTTPIVYVAANGPTTGGLQEVLAAAKKNSKLLSYGSHGDGTTTNYMGEQLKKSQSIEMVHVPFNGDNPILTAILGGHVTTGFLAGVNAQKAQESGKARMVAVASAKRSPLLAQVPTFSEQGVPGFDRESWGVVFVPTNTPSDVIEKISSDVTRVVRSEDVQKRFQATGLVGAGGTPAQTQQAVQDDHAHWQRQIRDFGSLVRQQ